MGETRPEWIEAGLPEECPDCGEDADLIAEVESWDGEDIAEVAEVSCMSCGYEFDNADSGQEEG